MYANVIVDISHEKLDKTFQYLVPAGLENEIEPGVCVEIPFGNRKITGYVVEITENPEFDVDKIKPLCNIVKGSVAVEASLVALASWIRKNYGATMNQALKTVIPVKKSVKEVTKRTIYLNIDDIKARAQLALCEAKHQKAKARLLRELIGKKELEYSVVTGELKISTAAINSLEESGFITIKSATEYRKPINNTENEVYDKVLNEQQQAVVDAVENDIAAGKKNRVFLIKGVTGSGKTEVYMELIDKCVKRGQQAIVLIPEIALTYQTAMRFYVRFKDRVTIMNSKLSPGERYDQFKRAKNGDIDIMIGPRSALFTPFSNLGLIIIDEEHETSYKSESVPRYHARETAIEYAKMNDAVVVLGSATPSVDSYYKAKKGEYRLLELKTRVADKPLPECEIVDMRTELKNGNRSILSERLQQLIQDRLDKKQQIILFINRRGIAGFMSCRSCGYVVKCPHCDVSLSQHAQGRMICHYCGYEQPAPKICPKCGSKYISGFKAGTQKIEEMINMRFPTAVTIRMDYDTTRKKDSYEKILQAFRNHEADILIGTQMIVKGHDFPDVTLVGVLAADMSLNVNDYRAAERTFQILTQAIGRAGRGRYPGNAIIQTYEPEHFAIQTAKEQAYEAFYDKEIEYRKMLRYPPVWNMLVLLITSDGQEEVQNRSEDVAKLIESIISQSEKKIQMIGPADAGISKINDVYRKVIYIKTEQYETLVSIKDFVDKSIRDNIKYKKISLQFDFNPVNGF